MPFSLLAPNFSVLRTECVRCAVTRHPTPDSGLNLEHRQISELNKVGLQNVITLSGLGWAGLDWAGWAVVATH